MAYRVTVKPTFRDLQGRFARAEKELLEARRDELRNEGRYLTDAITRRLQAKIGQNKIERGIRFNTQQSGNAVKLNVTTPGRAKPHRIAAKNANALAFFWGRIGVQVFVPRQGGFPTHRRGGDLWVGKGHVDHPGGSLVPLLEPIVRDVAGEWEHGRGRQALQRMATRYVTAVTR